MEDDRDIAAMAVDWQELGPKATAAKYRMSLRTLYRIANESWPEKMKYRCYSKRTRKNRGVSSLSAVQTVKTLARHGGELGKTAEELGTCTRTIKKKLDMPSRPHNPRPQGPRGPVGGWGPAVCGPLKTTSLRPPLCEAARIHNWPNGVCIYCCDETQTDKSDKIQ